jgi:hypothetical protein
MIVNESKILKVYDLLYKKETESYDDSVVAVEFTIE